MRRRSGGGNLPPKIPGNSIEGAAAIRQATLKLFARMDGEAADWPLIAESLFRVAIDCLDRVGDDKRRLSILRRLDAATYDRLARNEPEAWGGDPVGPPVLPIPEGHEPRPGMAGPGLDLGPRRPGRTRRS